MPVAPAWHEMHRACPSRLARKIGWTFVRKYSKSSDAVDFSATAGVDRCAVNTAANRTQERMVRHEIRIDLRITPLQHTSEPMNVRKRYPSAARDTIPNRRTATAADLRIPIQ